MLITKDIPEIKGDQPEEELSEVLTKSLYMKKRVKNKEIEHSEPVPLEIPKDSKPSKRNDGGYIWIV